MFTHDQIYNFPEIYPVVTLLLEALLLKAPPADIRKVCCMCVRLHSENSEPTVSISRMTPDEHPPTPPSCRWPLHITLPTLADF